MIRNQPILIVRVCRKNLKCVILILFLLTVLVLIVLKPEKKDVNELRYTINKLSFEKVLNLSKIVNFPSESEFRQQAVQKKIHSLSEKIKSHISEKLKSLEYSALPNYNVYIFYYGWYKSESEDGNWSHWNHNVLPDWRKDDLLKFYPGGRHNPPADIGSNYYPQLGCYSSRNKTVIDIHMRQIRKIGAGVVVLSWCPPDFQDSPDDMFQLLLDTAAQYQLKISPHIEPYDGRNPVNLKKNIEYLFLNYGYHEAFHKIRKNGLDYPVYFIYDSYHTSPILWRELLTKKGNLSVRGTIFDGVFLGLFADYNHRFIIKKSNFDGFYTYFASNGFTYGSTWKNWPILKKFASANNLLFVPCVGPGYIDGSIRPWNSVNTRHRLHGNYYEVGWRSALGVKADGVGITSFNEWHEGTQIEPAVPMSAHYLDYEPEGSNFYIDLTQWWVGKYNLR